MCVADNLYHMNITQYNFHYYLLGNYMSLTCYWEML